MPLTAAEKQKRYRERLKDKGEYEKYKEKNRKFQARKRRNLTKSEKAKLKEKNKTYKRTERRKKSIIESLSSSSNILSPSKTFSSRQSYGKARKRAISALPKSPNKRKTVVAQIAKEEGILPKIIMSRSLPTKTLDKLSQKVQDFYADDRISSQAPGLKDYIICRENDEKMRIQKRYLYLTLKEIYALFCEENPDIKIGLSKFCNLRPSYILLRSNIPHNVCLCQKHENIRLLLQVLKDKGVNVELKFKDFVKSVVCDDGNELCMTGECNRCPMLNEILTDEDNDRLHEHCIWKEWINTPHCNLATNEGTTKDCINVLNSKLSAFLQHTFIKRKQAEEFKVKRDTLKPEEVVMQIDFAENFSCKEQNEIQAAHWSHGQVTVFTAVCWYLENSEKKSKSFAIISDYLEHDKYAVGVFLTEIIKIMKSETNFSFLNIFSDGAASQFKQRFNLCNVTYFCKQFQIDEIKWHFFATSHGKGAVDGVGAQVKRLAWMEVLGGKSIQNAQDFFHAVQDKDVKINVLLIKEESIITSKNEFDLRFGEALAIPNIQKMHHFKTIKENVVCYSPYTQSTNIMEHHFKKKDDFEISKVNIIKESYYAVYYDLQYYIGRVIDDEGEKIKVKFLKKDLGQTYHWPRTNDVENIERQFIFYGPVTLQGSGPFHVFEENKIIKAYNKIKRKLFCKH